MNRAGFLLRVGASRNGRLRPQFVPSFCRCREVLVGDREVVLVRDGGRVSHPRTNDVRGEFLFEFGLPAGSAILKRLRPSFYAGTADDLPKRRAEILISVTSQHGNNPCLVPVVPEVCFVEERPQFGEEGNHARGLAVALSLRAGHSNPLRIPVNVRPP